MIIGKSKSDGIEYDSLIFTRRDIESIFIPSFIKYIKPFAFERCKMLHEIIFAEDSQLTLIMESAFAKSSISNIVIPKHVKQINDFAFYKCKNINDFKFDEDSELESFGYDVFSFSSLERITIPQHIKVLDTAMFEQCCDLNLIDFHKNSELTTFCDKFFNESPISTLYFPPKLATLEDGWSFWAFFLCNIEITPENENFKYLDSNDKIIVGKSCQNSTVFDVIMFACRDIEYAIFPPYIKEIKDYAFSNCTKLKTLDFVHCTVINVIPKDAFSEIAVRYLVIPSSVHLIKKGAFIFANMTSVEILGDNTIIFQNYSFQECRSLSIASCPNADVLIIYDAFCHISLLLYTCPNSVVEFN